MFSGFDTGRNDLFVITVAVRSIKIAINGKHMQESLANKLVNAGSLSPFDDEIVRSGEKISRYGVAERVTARACSARSAFPKHTSQKISRGKLKPENLWRASDFLTSFETIGRSRRDR